MLPGDDAYEGTHLGGRDRLVLCGSEAAFTSWWIGREVGGALIREATLSTEQGTQVQLLVPVSLDDYLVSGRWNNDNEEPLRSRLVADFTGWNDDDEVFTSQIQRLVENLRA